jgi:RNA polymerase sigma factor (TIGR02999 family)
LSGLGLAFLHLKPTGRNIRLIFLSDRPADGGCAELFSTGVLSAKMQLSMPPESTVTCVDSNLGAPPATQRLAAELIPLLYDDLRRVARRERARVGAGGTMQTTALVHEAYLRLAHGTAFNSREHFLRASALAMRHALVNHARDRVAVKRGGGAPKISLDELPDIAGRDDGAILDINDALLRLGALNTRLAQVVECRFFAGYDEADTALALGLTDRTVRRDWAKARAWLRRELRAGNDTAEEETL